MTKLIRLGDIIEQVRGVSYKPENVRTTPSKDSIMLLRANNIKDGVINYDDVLYVDRKVVKDIQILRPGDILVCASSGSKDLVGKAAKVRDDTYVTFGAFCKVVRPLIQCHDYLAHFFNSNRYRRQISSLAIGANINNIRNEHIDSLEIPLRSIQECDTIALKLNLLNGLIVQRNQQLSLLDTLVKARFVEMFGDPVLNPMGWSVEVLGDLLSVKPQNGLYKPQSDYVQDGTGTPILRIDAFYNGKVTDFSILKRLNCSEKEKNHFLLQENDIVVNRVNSIEYLGKCAWITGMSEPTVFESNMMRFHANESKLNPCYLVTLLCSIFIYNQILNRAKKAVNQASINQGDVESLKILVPPIDLQRQFASSLSRIAQTQSTIRQSLSKLETLRQSLMQEYFG